MNPETTSQYPLTDQQYEQLASLFKTHQLSWLKISLFSLLFFLLAWLSFPLFTTRSPEIPLLAWHSNAMLLFHEGGHWVFMPLLMLPIIGKLTPTIFLEYAGGTLAQLLIPLGTCLYYTLKNKYYYSFLGLYWFALNIIDISFYMDDARCRCAGGYITSDLQFHETIQVGDWTYMFGKLGLLSDDHIIATGTFWLGRIAVFCTLLLLLYYILYHIYQKRKNLAQPRVITEAVEEQL